VNKVVLDSSALLALLNHEPGAEKLTPELLNVAVCSTVNLAEVHSKLVSLGISESDAWTDATAPVSEFVDFTSAHAQLAGDLVRQTRPFGLSLGDRACLALGMDLGVPVYTADRAWKKLHLPVQINFIR
jgi:PIN domain nuclease of toxin-antitoxin system